MKVTKG